jgi:hypothetical protein
MLRIKKMGPIFLLLGFPGRLGCVLLLYKMPTPISPQIREFAERLFADEAATASPSKAKMLVAFGVCEKLRRPLTTLAGVIGFHSLLLRALTLAKREAPSLSAVEVTADGSLQDGNVEPNLDNHDDGGVLLVAHLLGLLFTFVGETLTLRLVHDVWPDASSSTLNAEGTGKHEP